MSLALCLLWQNTVSLSTNSRRIQKQELSSSRREWFQKSFAAACVGVGTASTLLAPPSLAADSTASEITDKIFLEIKGLPTTMADGTTSTAINKRIVIGLFGKDAPSSTTRLKQLVSTGLPAPCKPKEERMLQREQLEANKVYNSCIDGEDKGVNYEYSQIWRILEGERIDFGSVSGKFIAREFPDWEEKTDSKLKHDRPGLVSVRRGSESGFGFTVYPGGKGSTEDLDLNHIIVGQVIEGMDVIEELNKAPVITTAKVNYMGLTGGPTTKAAPSRSCRYGGPMYCNENKPLQKLSIYTSGIM